MNKNLFTTLLLFFPCLLFAQSNYQPGFVINLKGDTLKGSIDYREWVQNPKSISFLPKTTSARQENLKIADIQYFEITGFERYRRYMVSISQNDYNVQNLTTVADTSTKTGTVFLKILQEGKNVSLYAYVDPLKIRYYIVSKADRTPEELVYQAYLNPENVNSIQYRYIFRGQLNAVATNSGLNLSAEISTLQFEQAAILKVVSEINGNNAAAATQGETTTKSFRFFGGISGGKELINYPNGSPWYGTYDNINTFSTGLIFGGDFYTNPAIKKIVLRGEIRFGYANFIANTNSIYYGAISQHITQISASISPLFIFNFYNTPAVKIYAGTGFIINFATYPTQNYTLGSGTGATVLPNFTLASVYGTVPFRAGVVINQKFDINLGYCPPPIVENVNSSLGAISSFLVGVNYYFGK